MHKVDQKPYKGTGMEGWLARWYARTRRNDMEDFRRQARTAAEHLSSGCNVLEVAPGPGFFAIELAKLGAFKITGLDISRTFVEIATENARNAGVRIDFRLGNASAMPFADDSFDFICCSAAFKNFPGARQLVRRFRDQAALRTGSGNARSGRAPSRRQASSSPFRRAASSAAKASTPCGDQLIPWCLQRADTAQSLYFSTRVLAIHNPARCRCW